jgi:hypothetical protein
MSKSKETIFEADKINYVLFHRKSDQAPSDIKKAFIDFRLDGKRYRLTVNLKEKTCKAG